jgi:hypothetical protein
MPAVKMKMTDLLAESLKPGFRSDLQSSGASLVTKLRMPLERHRYSREPSSCPFLFYLFYIWEMDGPKNRLNE